jgi:vacuolar-type H+-ATPase subunit E/Vma4
MTTTVAPAPGPASESLHHQLEPVRDALLRDAAAEADRIVAAATKSARDVVAAATASADAEVAEALHRAELSAQAHSEQALARLRNDGHRVVLTTQQQLRQQLIGEVHSAAQDLRADPRYGALLDHLETLARSQLGDDVVVERDPEPDGGIIAEAGSRRVDYRLASLADRALDILADDVAELWN